MIFPFIYEHFTYNRSTIFDRYYTLPDCVDVPEDGNGVPEQVREIVCSA